MTVAFTKSPTEKLRTGIYECIFILWFAYEKEKDWEV